MPATKLPTQLPINGPRRLRRSRLMLLLSYGLWCQSDACGRTNSWTSSKRHKLQLKTHSQQDGHCIKAFNRRFSPLFIQFEPQLWLEMTTMRRTQAAWPAAPNINDICCSTYSPSASPLLTFYLIVALYANQIYHISRHTILLLCVWYHCECKAAAYSTEALRKLAIPCHCTPETSAIRTTVANVWVRIMISIYLVLSASENNVLITWELLSFVHNWVHC